MFSKFRFSSVKYSIILLTILAVSLVPKITKGAIITFEYGSIFNESVAPAGDSPWLTAIFDDGGTAGTVQLTMDATNLGSHMEESEDPEDMDMVMEFVSEWYFNLVPGLDPDDLTITNTGGLVAVDVFTGADAFSKTGSGGSFDIFFEFPSSQNDPNVFIDDETSVYDLSLAGLTASSFDAESTPKGDNDGLLTAAFVQGTGEYGQDSAWVRVPDPTTMSLLGIGLVGLIGASVRRRIGQKKVEGRK